MRRSPTYRLIPKLCAERSCGVVPETATLSPPNVAKCRTRFWVLANHISVCSVCIVILAAFGALAPGHHAVPPGAESGPPGASWSSFCAAWTLLELSLGRLEPGATPPKQRNQANHRHRREFKELSLGLGKQRNQANHGHTREFKDLSEQATATGARALGSTETRPTTGTLAPAAWPLRGSEVRAESASESRKPGQPRAH